MPDAALPDAALPDTAAPDDIVVTPPPETVPPAPETRAPFVVLRPLITAHRVCGGGSLVSLTPAQAAEHAALVRPAEAIDLSRWGRAVPEL